MSADQFVLMVVVIFVMGALLGIKFGIYLTNNYWISKDGGTRAAPASGSERGLYWVIKDDNNSAPETLDRVRGYYNNRGY